MEMTLEEITQQLYLASEKKRICRISLKGEPLPRLVQPYGVAKTSRNQIVLVCWQSGGLTKAGGTEGYRNLQLDRIVEVEFTDWHYEKRDDFNPKDVQYKDWAFVI
ncbi:MAG: WYL domain-containing protein [Bacteroidota bacterium]